jgi:hypothetical protein
MNPNRIHAHFGTINQLAADQGMHAGNVEAIRAAIRAHAQQALTQLGGGVGTEDHDACMAQVDRLIDEYINSTRDMQRSTDGVGETFQSAAFRARSILGSGAA